MYFRVYYEDTDCGGIVYHSNYLKFCERARSEVFFQKKLLPEDQNGFFVVSNIEAQFLGSAKLGDIIKLKTKTLEVKKILVILRQEIFLSNKTEEEKQKIFSMNVRLAFLDSVTKKPKRIPQYFLEAINNASKD